ncbi:MAG: hypothetical protein V7K88_29885 [Nostoc sp.]
MLKPRTQEARGQSKIQNPKLVDKQNLARLSSTASEVRAFAQTWIT